MATTTRPNSCGTQNDWSIQQSHGHCLEPAMPPNALAWECLQISMPRPANQDGVVASLISDD
eukprot:3185900-Alexandrium_andersonii.AAC.1